MKDHPHTVDRVRGPVVPLNVCFAEDGEIDYAAVRRYVDWLCVNEVPVLMLTYGSSEFASLSEDQVWRLTREVAAQNAGRSCLIASTGWWPPAVCRRFLKHAEQAGVDAVKVQVNPWLLNSARSKRDVFLRFHAPLLQDNGVPLLLWCPPPTYGSVPVDVIAELARHPRVIGVKNDGDPFADYYDLIRATADQPFAVISGGQMRNFMLGYQVGSPAYLCGVAPFRPDIALRFYRCLLERCYDDAWQIVQRYEDPWLRTAERLGWLPSIKSALHLFGLYPNRQMGAPHASHGADEQNEIRRCLESIFGPIRKVSFECPAPDRP